MNMYRPSELQAFLRELHIHPKKGLSQNFLIDGNIIRKIVESAQVQPEMSVLEIGPGPGSLTQALLQAGATVIAIEKDAILAQALQRLQTPDQRLHVICTDVLEFDFASLPQGWHGKVIANLPYHLTSPILAKCLERRDLFSSLTVMVQEEVAIRLTAHPGTKEYGSFTVFAHFYAHPHYAFFVTRRCFYPAPNVDSAVVHFNLKAPGLPIKEYERFFRMTRRAFEQRRKTLKVSLKDQYDPALVIEGLNYIGYPPLTRPEALSTEDFIHLYVFLTTKSTHTSSLD